METTTEATALLELSSHPNKLALESRLAKLPAETHHLCHPPRRTIHALEQPPPAGQKPTPAIAAAG